MKEKIRISNESLQIAREFRRLSQSKLAELIKVTQATVSKLESGITDEISSKLLIDIAGALDFPEAYFTQEINRTSMGSSALYNRGRKKLSVGDMKWIESYVNLVRPHVKDLLAGINVNSRLKIPELPIEDEGSAESIARKVRAFWGLPSGPIDNLTNLIEDAGALIIPFDFGTRHLDGTCLWLADCPPLIFVNESLPADRYRWTIAHELAHLVMHTTPRETQEDEADAFASELLMPASDIKPYLRTKLSIQYFADLKPLWGVAMASLARRAKDLRLMSDRQYKYYIINIRKLGLPEPVQTKKEQPSAWSELLKFKIEKLELDRDEIKDFLKAPYDLVDRYMSVSAGRSHLTVVK